jgi:hypothetical protein
MCSYLHKIFILAKSGCYNEKVQEIKRNVKEEKSPGFSEDDEGVL